MRKAILFLALPLVALALLAEAPMAFGKALVLASTFNGKLVDEAGAPQPGVKVTRNWTWAWGDVTGSDETETAADGTFQFPEVTGSSWSAGLVPHTPSILHEVSAHGPDGPVLLYAFDKGSYQPDAENRIDERLKGPGINLICRMDVESVPGAPFVGTCLPAP